MDLRDAWNLVRRIDAMTLARESFSRFRYGDGFSHARALGLQLSLAVIPLAIAFLGLSSTPSLDRMGVVLRLTLLSLSPGSSDALLKEALPSVEDEGDGAKLALWLGLLFALASLTTAMGQIERGANRIYGIQRDRPTSAKYGRAAVMAVCAGIPAMTGFLIIVTGAQFGNAVETVYGIDDDLVTAVGWPTGAVLMVAAIMVMLRYGPRRRQPGWSWLALAAGLALALQLAFTGLLAGYIQLSDTFGTVYGPLTGLIALLLTTQLTSAAVFLGLGFAAQLEAVRCGIDEGAEPDPAQASTSMSRRARPYATRDSK